MIGYLIIAFALVLFVQARNVYPQLLLGRLFFSLGGAAASTMVTAILPIMSVIAPDTSHAHQARLSRPSDGLGGIGHNTSRSISSESTITPARFQSRSPGEVSQQTHDCQSDGNPRPASSQIAGFVGTATGCGALVSLGFLLPMPARFQKIGVPPDRALQYSYYIVASLAFVLALISLFGLRRLQGEKGRSWRNLIPRSKQARHAGAPLLARNMPFWEYMSTAFTLGFRHADIGLGYLGGLVARASSVGISLFVPLLVNAAFLSSGRCDDDDMGHPGGLSDLKRRCPGAYLLAAELTGVSQLVALLSAPGFGYVSAKFGTSMPLILASVAGVLGYPIFANQFSPDDADRSRRVTAFMPVCLIGVSQIGAIVCSLATLSTGVLQEATSVPKNAHAGDEQRVEIGTDGPNDENAPNEHTAMLLPEKQGIVDLADLKGSIAGMYSLYGGVGILLLTKLGGTLFDNVSYGAPFYIMAVFNAILLASCVVLRLFGTAATKGTNRT